MMLQLPPEGVLSGQSIPRENEKGEALENYAKAKEQYIRSLERMEDNK